MVNFDTYTYFNSNAKLMLILTVDNCRNNLCESIKTSRKKQLFS